MTRTEKTLSESQIEGVNELCQLIMDATGCNSAEAVEKAINILSAMAEELRSK